MAEAAVAATLGIGAISGSRFIIRKYRDSRPKRRLQKWEDKVDEALREVERQQSKIKPDDIENLMEEHAMWEEMASNFKKDLQNKNMGPLNWKAWLKGRKIWMTARNVERLANITSAGAIRDSLRCRGSHRTKSDGCYFCAEQDLASASTSPEPAQQIGPQDETFNSLLISHPIVHVDGVDMNNSLPAGYQSEHGLLPMYLCVMPTARVDCVPSPSHFKLAATPSDTPPNVDVLAGTT